MEEKSSRSHLKRPFLEDEDSDKPPMQKRVRFPKGKKVKPGVEVVDTAKPVDGPSDRMEPRLAAKERAKRRNQITAELFCDDSLAEVNYEDNENFVDDGIQIEPFNLDQEREEGYFDADGNFVEYVKDNEIKDAWLDSVEVDPRFAQIASSVTNITNTEDDTQDLSSEDIGKMKRRIADLLEPGETVLRALRRLKGTNDRKEKMSAETKLLFDQLTEDAMKLMENGDYNVYHEKQEVFKREAEGYERLAQARGEGTSIRADNGKSDFSAGKDLFSDVTDTGVASSVLPDTAMGPSTTEITSSNDAETFDMFAEDDENTSVNLSSYGSNLVTGPASHTISQASSETLNTDSAFTTIAAVWATIMTHLLDCIAVQHQGDGTHLTRRREHMMKFTGLYPVKNGLSGSKKEFPPQMILFPSEEGLSSLLNLLHCPDLSVSDSVLDVHGLGIMAKESQEVTKEHLKVGEEEEEPSLTKTSARQQLGSPHCRFARASRVLRSYLQIPP
ncbi:hypothetical protein L1049_015199 [Liquidambar formosana]|uniref:CD2 antigen cytoplasmic tail-binding protein 2 n=1 Tax=Liquidambar formosana TaxID=63359 RepID=A0AAP0WZK3_LIQFO